MEPQNSLFKNFAKPSTALLNTQQLSEHLTSDTDELNLAVSGRENLSKSLTFLDKFSGDQGSRPG
jgi:hypothetical protein